MTEQNNSAAQEVSASTEEVSAQVQQVMASSSTLSEMAGQPVGVVAQFRLSGDELEEELASATGIQGIPCGYCLGRPNSNAHLALVGGRIIPGAGDSNAT